MKCQRKVTKLIQRARRKMDPCEFQPWLSRSGVIFTCAKICGKAVESYVKELGPGNIPQGCLKR